MSIYLSMAAGAVLNVDGSNGSAVHAGSCAAFKSRNKVLTAAHCVDKSRNQYVYLPGSTGIRAVKRVELHPTSDVAVLFCHEIEDDIGSQVFSGLDGTLSEGKDFLAYGYPGESTTTVVPPGRLLKGHFQRFMGYQPPGAKNGYFAGEMSIPAPAGMSGGPVVSPLSPDRLWGIVTANYDSYIVVDHTEEVEDSGKYFRTEARRYISYGISAHVGNMGEWFSEIGA